LYFKMLERSNYSINSSHPQSSVNTSKSPGFVLLVKRDSTFELTPVPYIDVCNKGKYTVDYAFDYNEISLMCGNGTRPAHIDRHFNYYRIEFIIGDPDSGESIYFEKDK
jgi:hypothetical protein